MNKKAIFNKYYPAFDIEQVKIADLIYYLGRDKKRIGPGVDNDTFSGYRETI